MKRVLSVSEMRLAEDYTINTLGIPHEVLVERAGEEVAKTVADKYFGGRTLIMFYKGNNGKDALICGKKLSEMHGFTITYLDIKKCEKNPFERRKLDKNYDIYIDGIFGTGLNREVDGYIKKIIDKVNTKTGKKVSIDIPSGLSGDSGKPQGTAIKADLTVAIGELKTGYYLNDGKDYTGEIILKDIGIAVFSERHIETYEDEDIREFFPKRKNNSNKGDYKDALLLGGSGEFFGAELLAKNGLTALLAGAGYAKLCVPEELFPLYAGLCPECTTHFLKSKNKSFTYDEEGLKGILKSSAIGVGMGAKKSEDIYKTVRFLLNNYEGKLLLDADALNSLSEYGVEILKDKKPSVIITPHVKEFSRLLGKDVPYVLDNFVSLAKEFAKEYNVVVVLKSCTTVITDGERVILNITGTPALAKGGSGDVLSGLITGLLARLNGFEAGVCGSYVLGKAGEIAAKNMGENSVVASSVCDNIPKAIKIISGN